MFAMLLYVIDHCVCFAGDHYEITRDNGLRQIVPVLQRVLTSAKSTSGFRQTIVQTQSNTSTTLVGPSHGQRGWFGKQPVTRFQIASGASSEIDDSICIQNAFKAMMSQMCGQQPALVLVAADPSVSGQKLLQCMKSVAPRTVVHALSSVQGALHNGGQARMGMLGIADTGHYTTGFSPNASAQESAFAAGQKAAQMALDESGLSQPPDVAVVTSTVGAEEEVLAGIADVLGHQVTVIGGSAADHGALDGTW